MSKITNDGTIPVWHRMLYSCTHMATVGVKGLEKKITKWAFPCSFYAWHC